MLDTFCPSRVNAETGLPSTLIAQQPIVDMTIGLALILGILLTALAYYGRQWWLLVWSIGLILCSLIYGAARVSGWA